MDGASKSAVDSKVANTTVPNIPPVGEAVTITGADVNSRNKIRDTRLLNSLLRHDERLAETLITSGADVNYSDKIGMKPLMAAATKGLPKIMKLLISSGADVNIKDIENNQALHWACQLTYYESPFEILLEAGADVNSRNVNGKTPLLEAVNVVYVSHYKGERADHVKAVNRLIKAGADVNAETINDRTALFITAQLGCVKCVKALLEAGADVNRCTNDGVTALMMASRSCEFECVDLLLAAGADVNVTDNDGGNVLLLPITYQCDTYYVRAMNRYPRCIKRLLKAGININKFSKSQGRNALAIFLNYKFNYQNAGHRPYNYMGFKMSDTEVNYDAAIMLLYAAGETLDGTEEEKIPEVLKFEDEKLQLKHICREAIGKHLLKLDLHQHLFNRIPELGLPSALSRYISAVQSVT